MVILQALAGEHARLLKYFVAQGRRHVVVLTLASSPDEFAARLGAFEGIASTFRLGG
jgi:hypothetical protein